MTMYKLVNDKPVPVSFSERDLQEFSKWFDNIENRKVASDTFGDVRVSTVFLGLDHNFIEGGPPVLWETVIFGGDLDGYCDRATSKEFALEAHARAVAVVKKAIEDKLVRCVRQIDVGKD